MDDDEFDTDFADEDLLEALDQASSSFQRQYVAQRLPSTILFTSREGQRFNTGATAQTAESLPSAALSSSESAFRSMVTAGSETHRFTGQSNGLNPDTFRQSTLWGSTARDETPTQTQPPNQRTYITDSREDPSHHELDEHAMQTWVYPTNLGAIRDYQFSIVKNSLFNNTLVALPTGLGKTFIAATVMLNFYRWTKSAKIIFVAPTKPLVAQQVDACYNIVGIPRSDTTLLTGDVPPALRVDEWETKRVFFMTPQTLMNDLSHGYADPKSIALIVIDEAHRAVGEYAYAKVTKFMRRYTKSFRVLALTATPGSKIETVQEVIDNLGISHCEIRTEDSIDIRQYVHDRNIQQIILDPSDEMNLVSELFTTALKPMMDKLSSQNIYYGRNPMAMTTYGLMQAQKEWFAARGRHANQGVQFMMRAIFSVLTGLAHSIKLLNFHGMRLFYDNMVDYRSEQEGKGEKGSKYKKQLIEHASFQDMMSKLSGWLRTDGFVGHPKLTALADCVLNHFMDQGNDSPTRVIVFSEYRDSAEDIVRTLNKHRPLLKASVFVGQAEGKRGEGMKQAQQIQTIERFRKGEFNVLVATSIGEEGLDIGQVDLIVCYDSSASPIRMLQRMGRTGRKRAGNIVLLLMRGKEEHQFAKSKDSYEKMQRLICEGSRFNFRFDLSTRIVPRGIRPEVDKKHVNIPLENTQNQALPEPKRRRAAGKKKPPKKFHMPDGVETGFKKVSDYMSGSSRSTRNPELDDLEEVPTLASVVLSQDDLKELDRTYRDLPFNRDVVEETDMPSMTAHPLLQRRLRPVANLKHGTYTEKVVKLLDTMGSGLDYWGKIPTSLDADCFEEPVTASLDSDDGHEASQGDDLDMNKHGHDRGSGPKVQTEHGRPGPRKRKVSSVSGRAPMETEDESSSEDENARETEQARTAKRARIVRKQKKIHKRSGINSSEIGDDCERDSDLLEGSDLDDGADLSDFVVRDDQALSSMLDSQATPPSTASVHKTPRPEAQRPFFVPTRFSATQESDDIPDLHTLIGGKKIGTDIRHDEERDSSPDGAVAQRSARGRRRVMDSDTDDE
ncbi:ATP-dependent DNA helicase mph1 [Moelleriella libera RCEF 2490]|uniref:ATP-dependent DNA helicase n=1 Tax=Moelleriella libera RCEF 2490 TaxID=1081109 RepID=A0A166UVC3_9HYPO|nr:ATP-dependent DNA helicase mph1 [Moelleriella libera RCEF 2490]